MVIAIDIATSYPGSPCLKEGDPGYEVVDIGYTACIKKTLHRFEIALKFAKQLLVSSF